MGVLDIKQLKLNMVIKGGVLRVVDYSCRTYANGAKKFIIGILGNRDATIQYKVWDPNLVAFFEKNDMRGEIIKFDGSVTEYKDVLEIKVDFIEFNHEFKDPTLFMRSVDVDAVYGNFVNFVNSNLSEKAIAFLMAFFQTEQLFEPFKRELAGSKMHDAQIGGLMNHTLKMLNIAKTLVDNDPRLSANSDLLYLGVILHDIGKTKELSLGVYTPMSFVTHRGFGVEMLVKYRQPIIDTLGEPFYYHLIAIIQGHHGQFGENPKTIWAYIVHLIDMLDAMVTGMLDKVELGDVKSKGTQQTVYTTEFGELTI